MTKHKTGTREEWLKERRELLKEEKELTPFYRCKSNASQPGGSYHHHASSPMAGQYFLIAAWDCPTFLIDIGKGMISRHGTRSW